MRRKKREAIKKVIEYQQIARDGRRRSDSRSEAREQIEKISKKFKITYGDVWKYKERQKHR